MEIVSSARESIFSEILRRLTRIEWKNYYRLRPPSPPPLVFLAAATVSCTHTFYNSTLGPVQRCSKAIYEYAQRVRCTLHDCSGGRFSVREGCGDYRHTHACRGHFDGIFTADRPPDARAVIRALVFAVIIIIIYYYDCNIPFFPRDSLISAVMRVYGFWLKTLYHTARSSSYTHYIIVSSSPRTRVISVSSSPRGRGKQQSRRRCALNE